MNVTVRVSATTSNLGGGFDCVGAAVDRVLTLDARLGGRRPLTLQRGGTLSELTCSPEHDLLVTGFDAACARAGRPRPGGLRLRASSTVPVGRGLGSSAAALVAGAVAANALLALSLPDAELLELGTAIEGHPDNVAPALFGGAVLAVRAPNGATSVAPIAMHESLRFAFAVPAFGVDTHRAREALPPTVTHADARAASAAAAALVLGLQRADAALLATGLEGTLHIPYRQPLVPGFAAVVAAAHAAGALGATLSGSGSSVVALTRVERAMEVAHAMAAAWRDLGIDATAFVSPPRQGGYEVTLSPHADARTAPTASDSTTLENA